MKSTSITVTVSLSVALLLCVSAFAQTSGQHVGEMMMQEGDATLHKKRPYSPFAGRDFPTRPLWGDTHLHTNLSLDARAFGVTIGVEEAYRLARGEEVIATHGEPVKLSRPLDFLVVADHSDAQGAMRDIFRGNPELLADPTVRAWYDRLGQGGKAANETMFDIVNGMTQGTLPEVLISEGFQTSIWEETLSISEKYNDPGRFTAMIGYEWTSTPDGNNLHRNVLYRDGADYARQMLPFTAAESLNPEDLWEWMAAYEEKTGGRVLAIAHNGNLSNGIMFPVETNPATGNPLGSAYMKERIKWEPLYEATQIKGDGEAHPYLSPTDEFADYDTFDGANLNFSAVKTREMLQYEYAREALKNGLKLEAEFGTNPYKFGMVGSTDAHTALAAVEESSFFGKHSGNEPSAERANHPWAQTGDNIYWAWALASAGYAAVWATENTREAIFDAMMRKETYATTGPRMIVRFFGGWDFEVADAANRLPAEVGYAKGVPMGGDLSNAPRGKSPRFLVGALKDPVSGNLDRIQIIKGWLDKSGKTHEKVYDVAWSDADTRKPDRDGKLPSVGNTVDVANATWSNTIGDPELITVWTDPDFDPKQPAVYYARVIEIPTPRWTAYDAKYFGVEMKKEIPMITTERAYTSPIWYTP